MQTKAPDERTHRLGADRVIWLVPLGRYEIRSFGAERSNTPRRKSVL